MSRSDHPVVNRQGLDRIGQGKGAAEPPRAPGESPRRARPARPGGGARGSRWRRCGRWRLAVGESGIKYKCPLYVLNVI
jgi:hypothetical protein